MCGAAAVSAAAARAGDEDRQALVLQLLGAPPHLPLPLPPSPFCAQSSAPEALRPPPRAHAARGAAEARGQVQGERARRKDAEARALAAAGPPVLQHSPRALIRALARPPPLARARRGARFAAPGAPRFAAPGAPPAVGDAAPRGARSARGGFAPPLHAPPSRRTRASRDRARARAGGTATARADRGAAAARGRQRQRRGALARRAARPEALVAGPPCPGPPPESLHSLAPLYSPPLPPPAPATLRAQPGRSSGGTPPRHRFPPRRCSLPSSPAARRAPPLRPPRPPRAAPRPRPPRRWPARPPRRWPRPPPRLPRAWARRRPRERALRSGCWRRASGAILRGAARCRRPPPPPPPPRTKWTRRVPHPVLIGHAASLIPY